MELALEILKQKFEDISLSRNPHYQDKDRFNAILEVMIEYFPVFYKDFEKEIII